MDPKNRRGRPTHEPDDLERAPARRGTALAVPKGPQGQKRPADAVGCAVAVARIATGEIEETTLKQPAKGKSGRAGSMARASALEPAKRSQIARIAAKARWS